MARKHESNYKPREFQHDLKNALSGDGLNGLWQLGWGGRQSAGPPLSAREHWENAGEEGMCMGEVFHGRTRWGGKWRTAARIFQDVKLRI